MMDRPPLKLNPAKRRDIEHRIKVWLGADLSTRSGRRRAWWATQLLDHAFLRKVWHNFEEVSPGVFRANQPDPARLAWYKAQGIKTIITLRGNNSSAIHALEVEACEKLGLKLHAVDLSARRLRPGDSYIEVLDLIAATEKPVLFHCKSGADRTGIIAAMHLIANEGRPVEEVRDQLSWRFIHSSKADTGILDHMLEAYRRTGEADGIDLRTWLRNVYDPADLTRDFRATPKGRRPLR